MLYFLVPLRAPQSTDNWPLISRLCVRTLKSVFAQTYNQYRVVLVCNEPPQNLPKHDNLDIVVQDFPLPENRQEQMADKWRKLNRGLFQIREYGGGMIMKLDPDDLVSNRLADWVEKHPTSQGAYVEHGYANNLGSKWAYSRSGYHRFCGSSLLYRCTPDELPAFIGDDRKDVILQSISHHLFVEHCKQHGIKLTALPFFGGVYTTGTGQNWSEIRSGGWHGIREFLSRVPRIRPVTSRLAQKFGLTKHDFLGGRDLPSC